MLRITGLTVEAEADNEKRETSNRTLLKNINLNIGGNEIHCLLGKNGSGKTTLAYVLMGLKQYHIISGKILFKRREITSQKPFERAWRGIALAFQEPARFEGLLVEEFLAISLLPKKKDKKIVKSSKDFFQEIKRVIELKRQELTGALETVGLDENLLKRRIDERLSGGERKRIELASVILMKPALMILDEPDASLDIIVYNELYELLLRIRRELACSILLITHREEAGLIANQATLLENGEVVATGNFRRVMRIYCQREGKREKCQLIRKRGFKF